MNSGDEQGAAPGASGLGGSGELQCESEGGTRRESEFGQGEGESQGEGNGRRCHGFKAIDGVYQWRGVTAALKFLYVGEERTSRCSGRLGVGRRGSALVLGAWSQGTWARRLPGGCAQGTGRGARLSREGRQRDERDGGWVGRVRSARCRARPG
jgi:hypothetical protein